MQDLIIQLIPVTVLGWVWLIPIYKACLKRGVSPWLWVGLCSIPFVGAFVVPVFWVTTIMDILDRMNTRKVFD